MGHRRTNLTTIRYSRFGAWESQWVSRTNYNSLLFQDFQINRYVLGISYKLRYPTSAIKIKRFSMNLVVISTTVYVPMTTNIGLLFFNSDYMAAVVVYMYRLIKFCSYINKSTRITGVVTGSARAQQLAYLYNTGHASCVSFKHRMKLYFAQYMHGLHALEQILMCVQTASIHTSSGIVSNTVFLGNALQSMLLRVLLYVLPSPSHAMIVHTQTHPALTRRVIQYNHKQVGHCMGRTINKEHPIAANISINLRDVVHSHRKRYKRSINAFIDAASGNLQQCVFSRFERTFDDIKACYSRLSFLYHRYIGLIDRSETIMLALVQMRVALSRFERPLRYMRAHIKRSQTRGGITRARMNAIYGASGAFMRMAQHIRMGQLYPDRMAEISQRARRKKRYFKRRALYRLYVIHMRMIAKSRRVLETMKRMSDRGAELCGVAKAQCKYVIAANVISTALPYAEMYKMVYRAARSKRVLKRMARPDDYTTEFARRLWSKTTNAFLFPETSSTISVVPVSKMNYGVLLRVYVYYIRRVALRLQHKKRYRYKSIRRWVRHMERWSMGCAYDMRRTMARARKANTLQSAGLCRVRNKLSRIRKLYKSLLWYERRILRMRIRTKHIVLNAISEYGRVHPPSVDTILVKRNILMVLAGQLMRLTARMNLRTLDNVVASARRGKTARARKRHHEQWRFGGRNMKMQRNIRGSLLSNILIALQQTASGAVSVRSMYSGLSRLQTFVEVLKGRIRRSMLYYTRIASAYIKKMGLFRVEVMRALRQVNKEHNMSSLIQQQGAVHSIVRAYTNYDLYTRLADVHATRISRTISRRRPSMLGPRGKRSYTYKPVFEIANSNMRNLMSATTNVSVDLPYICTRLSVFFTYTARIIHRAMLSRSQLEMPIDVFVRLLGELGSMNRVFVKYTCKVKQVQEYIYLTKVRMRYAAILGQNSLFSFIARIGRIFRSRQVLLYSGERWLFVKLGRVTEVMMHKWYIDTLTIFNLYMEDTLSRYLNMRVLLILNLFRERLKRRNPRIFIDRIGRKNQNITVSKRKQKFPPMNSAKLLCEFVRNRIERGAFMNRIFRDIRFWQKIELRKLNRLQHRSPKTYYRVEKKYPLDGIRILVSGPRKKAKRKKRVYYHIWLRLHDYSRRMPLQTMDRNIEFHKLHARRRASTVGVKVWLAFRTISENPRYRYRRKRRRSGR